MVSSELEVRRDNLEATIKKILEPIPPEGVNK